MGRIKDERRSRQQLWIWVLSLLDNGKQSRKNWPGECCWSGSALCFDPRGEEPHSRKHWDREREKSEISTTSRSASSINPPCRQKSQAAQEQFVNGWGSAGLSTGCKNFPSRGTGSQWQLPPSITLGAATLERKISCFYTHTQNPAALSEVRTQVPRINGNSEPSLTPPKWICS